MEEESETVNQVFICTCKPYKPVTLEITESLKTFYRDRIFWPYQPSLVTGEQNKPGPSAPVENNQIASWVGRSTVKDQSINHWVISLIQWDKLKCGVVQIFVMALLAVMPQGHQ